LMWWCYFEVRALVFEAAAVSSRQVHRLEDRAVVSRTGPLC
jgi:hypothetical protein